MKHVFSIVLVVLLVFGLAACDSITQETETTKPSSVSYERDDGKDAQTEESNATSDKAVIRETVLTDESGIKITAKQIVEDSLFGVELKLLIENNTQKDITVQARNVSVNGYMVETTMSVDVAAGKKANDSLTFLSSSLEACGIQTIADMEFSFHIFLSDGWKTLLDTKQIKLKTSAAEGYQYRYDNAGTTVYNANGMQIVAKGLSEDDSIFGPGLTLYLHNSTQTAVSVQVRDVSVNGFMVDTVFSEDIMPGKHALASVTFLESDLEENNISDIQEIEISFHIFKTDGWDTIVDTNSIKLTF